MGRARTTILLLLSSLLVPGPSVLAGEADAPDLGTVLKRHADARGGAERWNAVRTLKLEGIWEAFSTPGKFTAWKAAPDRWRFEHIVLGGPVVFASDGEHPWIQGAVLGVEEPARLEEAWARNLQEDARLLTPLLEGPGEKLSIELLGRRKVDGADTWALKVSRDGFPEETWYLDASSYLEVKRDSMTFDVFSGAIEIPMETFFDDFREVDGLVLPFHEERHFGTRYHVTDIETVTVDPEAGDALFAAPPPAPVEEAPAAEEAGDAEPAAGS